MYIRSASVYRFKRTNLLFTGWVDEVVCLPAVFLLVCFHEKVVIGGRHKDAIDMLLLSIVYATNIVTVRGSTDSTHRSINSTLQK